ncbi:MAG: RdgB/HAM1 family non-canonical purine NTP pyrophosphatase [Dehalococcoidia bacterium]
MPKQPKLLIATNNAGKVDEFRGILEGCGWQVVAPADVGISLDVDESGTTYLENARIKARAFAEASGLASLSDDSGLEVDALNGEPGALHHLHGWDGVDRDDRIAILLRAMSHVPAGERSARFRAVIVVALPDGSEVDVEGTCEGEITEAAVGEGGFGYDPVFFLPERGVTMAQLTPEEKNAISHRAVAAAKIRDELRRLAETAGADLTG